MNTLLKAAMASYGRSFLAGGLTLLLAGVNEPKDFGLALLAAVVPVLMRAINPNDPGFGRVPQKVDVEAAIAIAVEAALAKEAAKKASEVSVAAKKATTPKKVASPKRTTK